jgi:choline-glycine betaine transporter
MWFDVMRSYGGVGKFLSIFSLSGIVLYFVTSADSGSLVIDCLAANGESLLTFAGFVVVKPSGINHHIAAMMRANLQRLNVCWAEKFVL